MFQISNDYTNSIISSSFDFKSFNYIFQWGAIKDSNYKQQQAFVRLYLQWQKLFRFQGENYSNLL